MGILNSLNGISGGSDYQTEIISKSTSSDNIAKALAVGAISTIKEDGTEESLTEKGLPENNLYVPTFKLGTRIDSTRKETTFPKNQTFIESLIAYSKTETAIQRQSSHQELLVLIDLVKKYGLEYSDMAKDLKLNKYQFSSGQLKRKIATLEKTVAM